MLSFLFIFVCIYGALATLFWLFVLLDVFLINSPGRWVIRTWRIVLDVAVYSYFIWYLTK